MDYPVTNTLGSHSITFDSRDASFTSVDSRASDYSSGKRAALSSPEPWAAVKKQILLSPRASPSLTPRDKGSPDLHILAQLADVRSKSPAAATYLHAADEQQEQCAQQEETSPTDMFQRLAGEARCRAVSHTAFTTW
jgi:hypothetical protein